jgi:hypothetical protein
MSHLNIDRLLAADVVKDPFWYVVVPGFIGADSLRAINATFPDIRGGGSFPIENLVATNAIKSVIEELDGTPFQRAIEQKFDVELDGRPKMFSLRGHTRAKDGKIHTDSKDKIITALLYLNEEWSETGGRLRLLRNGRDVDDYIEEVKPDDGTLLVFKRSDNSWHGHHPFEGPRRTLQMNWMTSEGSKGFHHFRHKISAAFKKLSPTG